MADNQNLALPQPVLLSDEILAPEHREEGEEHAVDDETLGAIFGDDEDRHRPFGLECLTFTNGPLLAVGSWCIAAGILTLGFWPRDPYVPRPDIPPPGAVAGANQPLRLTLFQDMGASDAVCMDGTSSGYYYAPATTQPWLYVLYLEGSDGWCYDEPSCALRCGSAAANRSCGHSGSSQQWPDSKTFGGILSNNASVSPVAGAHKAFLADCSSDAFIGNASASSRTFGWHLKGQAAVEAAVTSLVRDKGLGSQANHTLVFGGASAGGMGAMLLLDHIPTLLARLGACPVHLLGFADSAYWIDDECGIDSRGLVNGRRPLAHSTDWPSGCRMNVQTRSGPAAELGPGHFPGFAGAVQGLLQLSNAESRLSAECLAVHRPGRADGHPGGGEEVERSDSWKCGLAHYQLPFVRSRYLMVSSLADSYQLTSNLGHRPATEAERAYALRFAQRSADSGRGLLRPGSPGGSSHNGQGRSMVYMPDCFSHSTSLQSGFQTGNLSGWSVADVLASMVSQPHEGHELAEWEWEAVARRKLPERGLVDGPGTRFAAGASCG